MVIVPVVITGFDVCPLDSHQQFTPTPSLRNQLLNTRLFAAWFAMAVVLVSTGFTAGCERAIGNSAEVITVTPTTKSVTVAREECHDELVTLKQEVKDPNRVTGTVAGAVIGGAIGNQVGGGSGRDIATVGGAIAGGYAGNKAQEGMQDRNTYQELQRVCETVNATEQVPTGYDVTYRLDGQERMIHLDYDPGSQLAVVDGEVVVKK